MKKLFQKILSIILAIFIPAATVSPIAEPVEINEVSVSASKDYIFGGTNYGQEIKVLSTNDSVYGRLYSNGEIIIIAADTSITDLVIPDEIDGYPVTAIGNRAFASEEGFDYRIYRFNSVIIGDNVRYIGKQAFAYQEHIDLIIIGKNVEEIDEFAFELASPKKFVWNKKIKTLRCFAFPSIVFGKSTEGFFPIPESIEHLETGAINALMDSWVARENVKFVQAGGIYCYNFIVLNMNLETAPLYNHNSYDTFPCSEAVIYCLENSTIHELLKSGEITNEYHLIENAYLTSERVNVCDDFTVSGLPSGLTEETIGDYLNIEGDAYIRTSDETIKTGTKIELVNESPEFVYKTYTACIDGDIDGDGSVNTTDDITAVRNIIAGNDSAFSEAHKKAADLNGDGLINSTDLVLMKSMQN